MYGARLDVRRLETQIEKYESVPEQIEKILFYGHSLFAECSWTTKSQENPMLEDCVRMKDGSQAIVNHGLDSSCAEELLYYYDRMVRPYKPRALVLSTLSNDVSLGYSERDVMEILARVIQWAQADFPGIRVYCFSTGVSVENKDAVNLSTRRRDGFNQLLKAFCDVTENCVYVPLHEQPFLYADPADVGDFNKIREDLFAPDQNQLTPEGYALFMDFLRELLDDLL